MSNKLRERILDKAQALFFRYGVKSVSMDDIARELGISKKTIYQHFSDKESILLAGVAEHFEQERLGSERIKVEAPDPIAEVVMTTEQMRHMLTGMNPSMLFDLKKYYPRAWELFVDFKNGFILNIIQQNLRRGIESGLYNANTNIEVLSRLRNEQIELGFDPQLFPPNKFSIVETQLVLLDHFIRGIVTPKGLALYEQYKDSLSKTAY